MEAVGDRLCSRVRNGTRHMSRISGRMGMLLGTSPQTCGDPQRVCNVYQWHKGFLLGFSLSFNLGECSNLRISWEQTIM